MTKITTIIIFLFFIIINCGKKSSPVDNLPINDYPSEVKSTFVSTCISSGGYKSYCECALEKIQRKYTFEKYAEMETIALKSGSMPDDFNSFIAIIAPICR